MAVMNCPEPEGSLRIRKVKFEVEVEIFLASTIEFWMKYGQL